MTQFQLVLVNPDGTVTFEVVRDLSGHDKVKPGALGNPGDGDTGVVEDTVIDHARDFVHGVRVCRTARDMRRETGR